MPSIPATQTAILQTGYGDAADVLAISTSHPVTPPAPKQVQIRVHAASMNPIDWQMIEGNRKMIARRAFPFVPLFDLSGVVVAVGDQVDRFKIGDEVHADNKLQGGGASQYVSVDEDLVSLKPPALGFVEAAAIPMAAQTALSTVDEARVARARVCVIGASGGVGAYAVQIAKALGATEVVGVCSAKNSAFVMSLGADRAIDYREGPLHALLEPNSLDAVIDCVGGRDKWLSAKRVLKRDGRFVTIARDEDGKVTVRAYIHLVATILGRRLASRFGRRIRYIPVFLNASHGLLDRVDQLVASRELRTQLDTVHDFSLVGLLEMIQRSKSGRVVGKCVMRVDPDAA